MGERLRALWQDARYGIRMIRRNPGFSIAAIATLALGIGGNTAIFTITSAVLLKPFPYEDPRKLVIIDFHQKDGTSRCCSLNRYEQIRDRSHSFSGVAVVANDTLNLTGSGEPQQAPIGRVSPNFFHLLGIRPQIGRSFVDEEGQPAGKSVVMISDSLWHTRFGGDPQIIGKTINLDSMPYSIIGVLPAAIQFPFMSPADVWTPRYFEHSLMSTQHLRTGVGYLTMIARLRPGVFRKSAVAEMEGLARQYSQENPKAPDVDPGLSPVVADLQEYTVANLRTRLLFLSLAVGVVLLIACANVASLLLSRALARRREIALRTALGASRGLIIRQLLTESVVLALFSGMIGLVLSFAVTRWLAVLGQDNLPQGIPIGMDAPVLLFTLTISVFTGIAFGIFPALQLARTDLNSTLRDEGRGSTGGRRRVQIKNVLVVGQVALSLLLLIGAGLLVRSFRKLSSVDPGFDAHNILTMNISLPTVRYANAQKQIAFFDELLRRVSALPGVRSAAVSAALPLTPKRITPILAEGQPDVALAERPFVIIEATSPGFLETMRIPLRAGRAFRDADSAQSPHVIIVNETLARQYWPNQNAVGRHIAVGRQAPAEIVGVAADTRNSGLALEPQPQIYLPFPQLPWGNMNLLVRTATDLKALVVAVRAQISAVDADQPVTGVQTVEDLIDSSRVQPRFTMFLLGAFSATALALAVAGIYGVLAYSVTQRRQELGIRLALGAEKSDILRFVVRQGLTLVSSGIAIGMAFAFVCTRLMSSFLYKVNAYDPATFVFAPLVFIAIGSLASYLPARRATQVDPIEALRGSN
jgi:putative ABC transport system permease protein